VTPPGTPYFADVRNNRIWAVSLSGITSTVSRSPTQPSTWIPGPTETRTRRHWSRSSRAAQCACSGRA